MISIAIHGGAGTILRSSMTPEKEQAYKEALQAALNIGYSILEMGGTSLDAVEQSIRSLEDCPLFNAGRGSVFTADGTHEMDASIMDGKTLEAGAVAGVHGVKNPVSLARLVMEKSGHVMLAAKGAVDFAREMDCEFRDAEYFYDEFRFKQWQEVKGSDTFQLDHASKKDEKFGTVGAVALDKACNLAAATSTGGMTNKRFGRIGDSPVIGSGTYANNNTCAVSCTGSGEFFLRSVVAYDVSCLMEYKGLSLADATKETIQKRLMNIGGDGGLIAVDAKGNISLEFNTEGMYRACKNSKGLEEISIYEA
jgi:beta-aspartyl-peptidase (threonine type)